MASLLLAPRLVRPGRHPGGGTSCVELRPDRCEAGCPSSSPNPPLTSRNCTWRLGSGVGGPRPPTEIFLYLPVFPGHPPGPALIVSETPCTAPLPPDQTKTGPLAPCWPARPRKIGRPRLAARPGLVVNPALCAVASSLAADGLPAAKCSSISLLIAQLRIEPVPPRDPKRR